MEDKKLHLISYKDFIKRYPYFKTLDPKFPQELQITTITITGALNNNNIDCENVNSESNILNLDKTDKITLRKKELKHILDTNKISQSLINEVKKENNFISQIKCGNNNKPIASIEPEKRHYKKIGDNKPKKRSNFFDQITLKINNEIDDINVNIKIFDSGSFHITGSKNLSSVYWILYRLFKLLKFYGYGNYEFKNISDFNVEMINCKVFYPFIIDRFKLYNSIINNNDDNKLITDASYDPLRLSCVQLKIKREQKINKLRLHNNIDNKIYQTDENISFMMYQYGIGIISGAINYNEIIYAYQIFYKYLLNHQFIILEYNENINYKEIIDNSKENLPNNNDDIVIYNEEVFSDNEIDTQRINSFDKAKRKSNKKSKKNNINNYVILKELED